MTLGDHLGELLSRMRPAIHGRLTRSALRARFTTSDVLQESAIQLLSEYEDGKHQLSENGLPQSLLNTIARGHAAKLQAFHTAQRRSVQRERAPNGSEESGRHCPAEQVERQETLGRLVVCLTQLPQDQRLIVDRRFFAQKTFASIAEEMDRPLYWVRRQYLAALRKLRSLLA